MPKLTRKMALLAKIEAPPGTDSVPVEATNAILVSNFTLSPLEQQLEDREISRPWLGHSESIEVARWTKMEFEVELAGSGAAGTAPKWDVLMLACGMSKNIAAGTSVTYAPVSGSMDTATLYCNVDGVLHKMTYARGTFMLSLDARKIPKIKFAFTGLFKPVADAAVPNPTYTGWTKPVGVNVANTTLSLFGFAAVMETLQLDIKNQVIYRNLVGFEGTDITDRKPDGSISFENTSLATKNWWTEISASNTGVLNVVHGVTVGNIVEVNAPQVQLLAPRFGASDGVQMLQPNLKLMPGVSGNADLLIIVR